MKTLIIGYGNPLREDDGVGIYTALEVEKAGLPDVEVMTVHQLQLELTEELLGFDRVIFADCREAEPDLLLEKIRPAAKAPLTSSHHLGPEVLGRLARQVYGHEPELFLCSIRGESFEFRSELSAAAAGRARQAAEKIKQLVRKEAGHA